MVIVICKICKRKFRTKFWLFQQGWSQCCSRKCRNEAQKRGRFVKCSTCGKSIWRGLASLRSSKSGKFFCTKSCQTLWRNKVYTGPNHALWIGGSSFGFYRKKILESNVPVICNLCKEKDTRVLEVHHKDGNRQNNEIDNLVWICLNCHHLMHFHDAYLS